MNILKTLVDNRTRFDYIVIETDGLTDPIFMRAFFEIVIEVPKFYILYIHSFTSRRTAFLERQSFAGRGCDACGLATSAALAEKTYAQLIYI